MNDCRMKWLNRTAQDVYTDCSNIVLVVKNKLFNEYIPYIEKLHSKTNEVSVPEFPPIPSIINNDDKEFQLKQEKTLQNYMWDVCGIVRDQVRELPIRYVSDAKYFELEKYGRLFSYVRYIGENNNAYVDNNWGYTTNVL